MAIDGEAAFEATGSVMTLRLAAGIYAACLAVSAGAAWAAFGPLGVTRAVPVVAFLGCGVVMNRVVLRRLITWHPVYNTLDRVTHAKVRLLVFWPTRYPVLFVKLLIDRYL